MKWKWVWWAIAAVALVLALTVVFWACGWVGSAADVARQEVDPRVVQEKYEWFKEIAAELDAKSANIEVQKLVLEQSPGDNVALAELAAVIMSYNDLAAGYNAQMAKWNWRFANRGGLPEGATEVLPREYREYREEL